MTDDDQPIDDPTKSVASRDPQVMAAALIEVSKRLPGQGASDEVLETALAEVCADLGLDRKSLARSPLGHRSPPGQLQRGRL